jgi:hypothetical protein
MIGLKAFGEIQRFSAFFSSIRIIASPVGFTERSQIAKLPLSWMLLRNSLQFFVHPY